MFAALISLALINIYRTRKAFALNEEHFSMIINESIKDVIQIVDGVMYVENNKMTGIQRVFLIDSLINNELSNRQIITQIEWGLYSLKESKLIYQKTGKYGVELLLSPYFFELYRDKTNDNTYVLCLYFPYKASFILSQVWFFEGAVVFLFLIQILVFAYILNQIVKQRKLAELKTDFINHITHEIKTPISTISLICESFNDTDISYDEKATKDLMSIIQQESNRLHLLSKQIIEISKLERGEYFLHKIKFDLHSAIEEAISNTGYMVMHNNGRIETSFLATNSEIYGDRTHIVYVISNLIDNANKYSLNRPIIKISTFDTEKGVQINVADNGTGISKQHINKIFEKLYRIPTGNTHDVKGFGLGLSYVKSIIEQHNAKIWVDSVPKKGSTFHLIFFYNKHDNLNN